MLTREFLMPVLLRLCFIISCFFLSNVYASPLDDLDATVRAKFEGKRWELPARVYARPLELYAGAPLNAKDVKDELKLLNYREQAPKSAGMWQEKGSELYIYTRAFMFSDGAETSRLIRLHFDGNKIKKIWINGAEANVVVRLEPLEIGGIYPKHNEDRILIRLSEAPTFLVEGLLATEDRNFYSHHGVSVKGVLRAVWSNVTRGRMHQGGSTITQQLVKNFYLSSERTLSRKINEAAMALILESHYSKNDILETYLNEVNLGQNGERSINGFGLASQFYFGRPIGELELHQAALLAGMVQGPSLHNPRKNPESAKKRRNIVIKNLEIMNKITPAQAQAAMAKPLDVADKPMASIFRYPAFFDVVRRELLKDYKLEELSSDGVRIFTTLDPRVQKSAETAFINHTNALKKSPTKKLSNVQAAMVIAQPDTGELLSVIGGVGDFTGFNRALDAKRQIGSLIKPAVYLSALESGQYQLNSLLSDDPISVKNADGSLWQPTNDDGESHGQVLLYNALAHSYNQATINMGLALGVPAIIKTLQRLGVSQAIDNYPSLLLGTLELSPMDVLGQYQTYANNGFKVPLRSIREVVDSKNKIKKRYELSMEQIINPINSYLLSFAMQQTLRKGTASKAYDTLPNTLVAAGKTGTTNALRDAWFAGYTGNYVAVVWVGHDDNHPTGLYGASGALPIWIQTMAALHPLSIETPLPEGLQMTKIDSANGLLADDTCARAIAVPLRIENVPTEKSSCEPDTVQEENKTKANSVEKPNAKKEPENSLLKKIGSWF
jgi:penicillin-binding protein 1B